MSRAGASAVLHAVRGPTAPRASELEILRPSGPGVGACFLDFELCPECGERLVEHNGLPVCSVAATPVYEPPQLKTLEQSGNGGNGKGNGCNPVIGCKVGRALEALAGELRIPASAVLGVYNRLKKRAGAGEAAAVALFAAAKRSGTYVSLAKACELLSRCGVKVEYKRAFRAFLLCSPLLRPSVEEALEAYTRKLGLNDSEKRAALELLRKVKPYAGGRAR